MKSIHNRATSPMLRPIRFTRMSTISVAQIETGTVRPWNNPMIHHNTEGSPSAIASSIGLAASQYQ